MSTRAIAALAAAAALALAIPAAAAEAPTVRANPLVVGTLGQVTLSGTSPRPSVSIEARDCESDFFRLVGSTQAIAGGGWTYLAGVSTNTSFRARAGNAVSRAIVVRRRASVDLVRRGSTRLFVANVHGGGWYILGRRIRLERLTDDGWVLVGRAKLRKHPIIGRATATFRVQRKGLILRGFLPEIAAKPCLAAAASPPVRS
jgi:hypothetical protein